MRFFNVTCSLCGAAMLLAASACQLVSTSSDGGKSYKALGYYKPQPEGEGRLIGLYADIDICEAAISDWLARQVVGTAISATCVDVDAGPLKP